MQHFTYDPTKLPKPYLPSHENYLRLYNKAWEIAFKHVEVIDKPGWKPILTSMPGVGVTWQWDSCIMTFITNYANGTLSALNNLDNLYRLQREDGYMCMSYRIETDEPDAPGRINPPLMAWAEWTHYQITGDDSRLEWVLPHLEGFYRFIENNRRRKSCQLYWFEDSGSSGMDNSPRSGYNSERDNGSDVCFIDLACQQALSAKHIALICDHLNLQEKKAFYESEQARINNLINQRHWSDRAQWYFDFFQRTWKEDKVKFINSKTGAAFWTLLCGAATGSHLESVVHHLFNPDEFYTKVPFATLAKDDPNYDPTGGYWLGGVWPPTNYAAIRGLAETGRRELAREAAVRVLDAMCAVHDDPAYGSIWECYAPESHRPATTEKGEMVRNEFVGWGGIAPITMLIENIIGLEFDAPQNTVTFHLHAHESCGLENMCFNGQSISVVCEHYSAIKGKTVIRTQAEKPFTLVVNPNYMWAAATIEVPCGDHTFTI